MIEKTRYLDILSHLIVISGILLVAFPLWLTFVASTHGPGALFRAPVPFWPGDQLWTNYEAVLFRGVASVGGAPIGTMLFNSLVMALAIAIGKIVISLLSAFAIVYFRFPFRMLCFWTIFITLMLPVEVRILPTYQVAADLNLLNTYTGLVLPIVASATATFLFRQFFLTVPDELTEAARIDGAGPMKFFWDILLPLSKVNIAALFVIMFIYGWNQYLWPLLITTGDSMTTIVMGIKRMAQVADAQPVWHEVMAVTTLALLPPVVVVVLMQRWFVKGLIDTEK